LSLAQKCKAKVDGDAQAEQQYEEICSYLQAVWDAREKKAQ
jgi:hypothetical protein